MTQAYPVQMPLTPSLASRPLRIGLISNPDSRRNRKAMPEIRKFLNSQDHVISYEANTPADIKTCLESLAEKKPDLLAINGGDGTVQAALSSLFSDQPFSTLPMLALIPGGNTNMTAHDLGLTGGVKKSLVRLCNWARSGVSSPEIIHRPIIRVQTNPASKPLFGLFFGAGAITKGIEYCHQQVYSKGLHDELASGVATMRLLWAIARRDPRFTKPLSVSIGVDGQPPSIRQDCLLLLVSTLERLFLGIHPYWGSQHAPLHYTFVRSAPVKPLRTFPGLLRGQPNRFATPANGYESNNLNELQLSMDGLFTLDGELYEASIASGPVLVSHTEPVSFLRV